MKRFVLNTSSVGKNGSLRLGFFLKSKRENSKWKCSPLADRPQLLAGPPSSVLKKLSLLIFTQLRASRRTVLGQNSGKL